MGCEHWLTYEQAEQEAAYQNIGTQGSGAYRYKTKSMYDPQPKLLSEPRDYLIELTVTSDEKGLVHQ